MNSKIRNIALFVSTVFVLLSCAGESKTTPNKDKAEEMFQRVWELYRVPKYGLFSEYYPSSHRPDLTYFNDSTRQAQEVSYLWPMSGVFSSAVLMATIEPEKYTVYVDSMVMAMERYYDTTRVPFGYQAYPVQFGKVDRYYDDNGYEVAADAQSEDRADQGDILVKVIPHVVVHELIQPLHDELGRGLPL